MSRVRIELVILFWSRRISCEAIIPPLTLTACYDATSCHGMSCHIRLRPGKTDYKLILPHIHAGSNMRLLVMRLMQQDR